MVGGWRLAEELFAFRFTPYAVKLIHVDKQMSVLPARISIQKS
jgi:hypothetical protein